ncbi:M48 family metalloprotease [Diaphorobacter sp. C33]|uniref:Zn-dependent protease with chaperone function n=1 Tax=Diaphorobacter nitroreducens TaxID=164759 RepID=A0AAX1WTP3_9BURK|nr:M48 family metalloprotease [Diaphorobacter sp. C33]ROR41863.1 Zn-dependent protease with chaperone function [Diaphorobacter nitroreducens]WKK88214.1 M48 family metalloprotease [Diaphorobacter sp. C33]
MEKADFIHMVRMSEMASADDSRAYRRGVAAFAALGYAWVLGCLALAVGMLVWVVPQLLHGKFRFAWVWIVMAACGLLWLSLRALWVPRSPPHGVQITAREAPALFDALERIRRKIKGPPIHEVYLDDDFNASIRQEPRWGVLGGARNQLTLGLPLLMALDKKRLLAVLAHEYGHLRGDHGRFAAWIYRTRLSWHRLHEGMQDDAGPMAVATRAFLDWYWPRFAAKTFALARQDEYEADRIAARLLGQDEVAAALTEVEIKGAWLGEQFWRQHWQGALSQPLPAGPYGALQRLLALPPEPAFAQMALRDAVRRLSGVDDTHPVLRDRVEALTGGRPTLPPWSQRGALSLLGAQARGWLAHFDDQWCKANATVWKQHHARLQRAQERVRTLQSTQAGNSATETVELARLMRRLDPQAAVQPLYERVLAREPAHVGALLGLADSLAPQDVAGRLRCCEALWDCSPTHRWGAARGAVQALEQRAEAGGDYDAEALKRWRERVRQAEEVEDAALEELYDTPFFQRVTRHDLSAFELGELQAELALHRAVARAWLVCKQLRAMPQRRTYLLFVQLRGLDAQARFALCRRLESELELPGQVLVLAAGDTAALEDIERQAFEPVHAGPGGA